MLKVVRGSIYDVLTTKHSKFLLNSHWITGITFELMELLLHLEELPWKIKLLWSDLPLVFHIQSAKVQKMIALERTNVHSQKLWKAEIETSNSVRLTVNASIFHSISFKLAREPSYLNFRNVIKNENALLITWKWKWAN